MKKMLDWLSRAAEKAEERAAKRTESIKHESQRVDITNINFAMFVVAMLLLLYLVIYAI
ncbi:MAG: hypothetical protein KKI07_04800 [Euryarchaeota archaeon]|nr:hypothetical protein [Euryarchaeota archaeon]